jgi:hypothetical protein
MGMLGLECEASQSTLNGKSYLINDFVQGFGYGVHRLLENSGFGWRSASSAAI